MKLAFGDLVKINWIDDKPSWGIFVGKKTSELLITWGFEDHYVTTTIFPEYWKLEFKDDVWQLKLN